MSTYALSQGSPELSHNSATIVRPPGHPRLAFPGWLHRLVSAPAPADSAPAGIFMPARADLDAIDWKILRELQADGRMTNVELSSRVGISAPPCLRRVKRLERDGIIRGYRALLDANALGKDVVAFCHIGLHRQSETDLKVFADLTRAWPIVRAAWMVSGDSDFLLHCVASDLATFQGFVIEQLTSTPNVDTVRTTLTIRQVKDEGAVAIGE
jgi:DNA-binding Lrp family transcriptional regulator